MIARNQLEWMSYISKGQLPPGVVEHEERPVSMEELRKHNREDDLWMAIDGVVYDCTGYVQAHPGGKRLLLSGGGRDATNLFTKFHPWVSLQSMMAPCVVGPLVTKSQNDFKIFPRSDLASPTSAFLGITFRIHNIDLRGTSRIYSLVPEVKIDTPILSGFFGIAFVMESMAPVDESSPTDLPAFVSFVSWNVSSQVLTLLQYCAFESSPFNTPHVESMSNEGNDGNGTNHAHRTPIQVRLIGPVPRKERSAPLLTHHLPASPIMESYHSHSLLLRQGIVAVLPFPQHSLSDAGLKIQNTESPVSVLISYPGGFTHISSETRGPVYPPMLRATSSAPTQPKNMEDVTVLEMHSLYRRQKSGGLILFSTHHSIMSYLPLLHWERNWSMSSSGTGAEDTKALHELSGQIQITCVVDMTMYSMEEVTSFFCSQQCSSTLNSSHIEVHYVFNEDMKTELSDTISQYLRGTLAAARSSVSSDVEEKGDEQHDSDIMEYTGLASPVDSITEEALSEVSSQPSSSTTTSDNNTMLRRSAFHPEVTVPCYYSFVPTNQSTSDALVRSLLVRGILPQPDETQCVLIHGNANSTKYDFPKEFASLCLSDKNGPDREWEESIRDQCLKSYYLVGNVVIY